MNYHKTYITLIEKGKNRELVKEKGYEIHHIIPKSVGGSNNQSNLVKLTYREHFIAHVLLTKLYPMSYELLYSAWKFTYSSDGHNKKLNSRTHKILKEKYIQYVTIKLDEEELKEYFSNDKNSICAAAKYFGYNWATIKKNLDYYNIEYLWDGTYNEKFDKDEIINMLQENKYKTLRQIANIYNMKYWQLNNYIKEYNITELAPIMLPNLDLKILNYIDSGAKHIHSLKLHKVLNVSPYRVARVFKEHNITYISIQEENAILYNKLLNQFLIDFFTDAPPDYSMSGFAKLFKNDYRTIAKKLKILNIEYNYNYKHHKGIEYEKHFGKFIKRGIDEGIFKK